MKHITQARTTKTASRLQSAHPPKQKPIQQHALQSVESVPQTAYHPTQVNRNGQTSADFLALQRTIGNRNVQRLVAYPVRQVPHRPNVIQRGGDEEKEAAAVNKLKTEIMAKFSFKSVEDGDKAWTSADLTITRDALAMIPAVDLIVLSGVVLKRVVSLGGKTAGRFSSHQAVQNTTVTNDFTLELADLAFQGSDIAEKKRTVQHEVGHAIASQPTRTATHQQNQAIADFNRTVDDRNITVGEFNSANDEFNTAVDAYNAKVKEYNEAADAAAQKAIKPELDRLKKEVDIKRAQRTAQEKILKKKEKAQQTAENTATTKKAAAKATRISQSDLLTIRTTADTAKAVHDRKRKAAETAVTADLLKSAEATTYYESIKIASQSVQDFFDQTKDQTSDESTVDALIATTTTALADRATASAALQKKDSTSPLLTQLNALETAQDKFFTAAKANALAHQRSKRVQNFVKFVESKKIAPITAYARENWPHKPEEFYAEAYSFWVSGKLAAVSTGLNAWFAAGNYKK